MDAEKMSDERAGSESYLYLSKRSLNPGIISLLVLFCFIGCAQAVPLITIAPTAVQFGSVAYQSIEKADIDVVILQNVSKEDLGAVRHIAIFMGVESLTRPYGRIGDLASVVGDNLRVELAKLGFQIYGWSGTERNIGEKSAREAATTSRMVESGRELGVQTIVTGNVTAGHIRSFGMLGVGRFKTVVQSAILKVIDVKTANTLMIITINYKVGQNPKVAAEGMAMVLKVKLEDPFGDPKERLKEKTKEKA